MTHGASRIIVNPSSGGGRAARRMTDAKALLDGALAHAEWHVSRSAQHVTDLCHDAAARQFARVIVAGGDGTVHHAVRGLVNARTALGIIPSGTGNDFAAAARIPTDAVAAARVLLAREAVPVDVGAVNGVPFCCVAGLGLDTPALEFIERSRIRPKRLAYQVAAIRALLACSAIEIGIRTAGATVRQRILFAAFCNTPTYAGGNPVAPDAGIFDGQLDYCVFRDQPLLQRFVTFAQMRRGRHPGRPGVRCGTGAAFRVDSEAPVPITLDGELTSLTTPADIVVLPGALQLIAGPAR